MAFRTQKISQMTPKGSDLEATDLIEVSTIESGSYVTRSITGQELIDAIPLPPSGITIGTTAITSGTVGRVLFQGTGNVVSQSANLFWDETNGRLGIGTNAPSNNLQVLGASGTIATVKINTANRATGMSFRYSDAGDSGSLTYNNIFYFTRNDNTFPLYLSANSNVLINTITDAGYRLDVNGTARVGGLRLNSTGDTIEFNNTLVRIKRSSNRMNFEAFDGFDFTDTNISATRLRIFGTTGNIGINTTTDAGFRLDVNGTARVQGNTTVTGTIGVGSGASFLSLSGAANNNVIQGNQSIQYQSAGSTVSRNFHWFTNSNVFTPTVDFIPHVVMGASFAPTSGTGAYIQLVLNPTINQTGGANGITRGLYINPTLTAAADFRAIETTNGKVIFGNLPTSPAGLPTGAIYNNLGVLMIV